MEMKRLENALHAIETVQRQLHDVYDAIVALDRCDSSHNGIDMGVCEDRIGLARQALREAKERIAKQGRVLAGWEE